MRGRKSILLVLLVLLLPIFSVQAANYNVRATNLQGWAITPDGTVPYGFVTGAASTGLGSLQFGPIDGTVPANKFIMFAPVNNMPMSNFQSISYDFYIDPASIANSHQQLYTNIYIDQAANGIGAFAGGTGFYDCRYDFVPGSGTVGGWSTFTVNLATAFTGLANRTGTCPATLGGLTAADQIRFIPINGGQSTAADAGLIAGFDNVVIGLTTGTDVYNFEPLVVVGPGGTITLVRIPLDDRINNFDEATPIAAYGLVVGEERGLIIYEIDSNSQGFSVLVVSPEEIAAVPELPETNTLIAQTETDNLVIYFWRLSSGEFQINVIQPNGKMYVLIFTVLDTGGGGYTSFEYTME